MTEGVFITDRGYISIYIYIGSMVRVRVRGVSQLLTYSRAQRQNKPTITLENKIIKTIVLIWKNRFKKKI